MMPSTHTAGVSGFDYEKFLVLGVQKRPQQSSTSKPLVNDAPTYGNSGFDYEKFLALKDYSNSQQFFPASPSMRSPLLHPSPLNLHEISPASSSSSRSLRYLHESHEGKSKFEGILEECLKSQFDTFGPSKYFLRKISQDYMGVRGLGAFSVSSLFFTATAAVLTLLPKIIVVSVAVGSAITFSGFTCGALAVVIGLVSFYVARKYFWVDRKDKEKHSDAVLRPQYIENLKGNIITRNDSSSDFSKLFHVNNDKYFYKIVPKINEPSDTQTNTLWLIPHSSPKNEDIQQRKVTREWRIEKVLNDGSKNYKKQLEQRNELIEWALWITLNSSSFADHTVDENYNDIGARIDSFIRYNNDSEKSITKTVKRRTELLESLTGIGGLPQDYHKVAPLLPHKALIRLHNLNMINYLYSDIDDPGFVSKVKINRNLEKDLASKNQLNPLNELKLGPKVIYAPGIKEGSCDLQNRMKMYRAAKDILASYMILSSDQAENFIQSDSGVKGKSLEAELKRLSLISFKENNFLQRSSLIPNIFEKLESINSTCNKIEDSLKNNSYKYSNPLIMKEQQESMHRAELSIRISIAQIIGNFELPLDKDGFNPKALKNLSENTNKLSRWLKDNEFNKNLADITIRQEILGINRSFAHKAIGEISERQNTYNKAGAQLSLKKILQERELIMKNLIKVKNIRPDLNI